MRLSCSIQPRATCIALVVSSFVTFAAVGVAAYLALRPAPACPVEARVAQPVLVEVKPPPEPQWATTVRDFSSEYSTASWSAQQALGAPNVFPRSGDLDGAWASREPDGSAEFIELGFAQPQRASALEVYETFNAGAITRVELITEDGRHLVVPRHELRWSGGAAVSSFVAACTAQRIVAARLFVDSGKVAGWNEVDAVGLLPCP